MILFHNNLILIFNHGPFRVWGLWDCRVCVCVCLCGPKNIKAFLNKMKENLK